MCGILALFGEEVDVSSYLLNHRGPDAYRTATIGRCRMDFYRLSINDLTETGMQPFMDERKCMLVCNGEIYNWKKFKTGAEKGSSDCEILMPLIKDVGVMRALPQLSGDFAFAYSDGKHIIAGRDPIGVRPLFYTRYEQGSIAFASEAKALLCLNSKINVFPPGHIYDSRMGDFICYYNCYWHINKALETDYKDVLKKALECAVHERLMTTERDTGFLLSGGLDSSLIASIASRKLGRIKTFSIGLEEVPIWRRRGRWQTTLTQNTQRLRLQPTRVSHI